MTYSSEYDSVRATVDSKGSDSRVEVNQRALIDKILARYASAGAVYRELIQNSNDAEATKAEIHITTNKSSSSSNGSSLVEHPNASDSSTTATTTAKEVVTQVVYRNNGMPFRTQDWARLKKIAEGNPDVSKVGAFGVGAYTMFSICEEPLILSGKEALAFVWKGDSLYTRVAPNQRQDSTWTTFVLPSRDPYPVPDLTEFGKFLGASLTFTQCLQSIQVTVNGQSRLSIEKSVVQPPTIVQPPSKSSFWSNDGAVTASPQGLFKFQSGGGVVGNKSNSTTKSCIRESIHQFRVQLDQHTSTIQARYVSGIAKTKIPTDMAKRMERVTKKQPPPTVHVQLFLNAQHEDDDDNDDDDDDDGEATSIVKRGRRRKKTHHAHNAAQQITSSLSPQMGTGRIFIGFRTSQTTGLAAHVAAPLLPTVEREAIDFQDPTLRIYNIELLELAGILMRLTLEHSMTQLGQQWEQGFAQRQAQEQKLLLLVDKQTQESKTTTTTTPQQTTSRESSTISEDNDDDDDDDDDNASTVSSSSSSTSLIGFARFMAKGVKKKIVSSLKTVSEAITLDDGSAELFNPRDPLPLSHEERLAIVLMRSFCPQQSTPDTLVGTILAQGFSRALAQSPPVLTKGGLRRGQHAKLPHYGMEVFVDQTDIVRSIVLENAREYHEVIARCRPLTMEDVTKALGASHNVLEETKVIRFLKWWCKYYRVDSSIVQYASSLRNAIRFFPSEETLVTLQTKQSNTTTTTTSQSQTNNKNGGDVTPILRLRDIMYYVDESKFPSEGTGHQVLPMPDSVLPPHMQQRIGGSSLRIFYDEALRYFFESLNMEVWAEFISNHRCMTAGQPEDELQRTLVLTTLHKEYHKRPLTERVMFASYLQNLLSTKRCIPFDSQEPTQYAADYPADLYLYSAELKAFDGVSGATGFNKVSLALKDKGVSDEFLVSLGVRKSVAIDFLFQNLDTLSWSSDPKPLVEYLRTAVLTNQDLAKLKGTQYLPAENDVSRTFAPSELYLPSAELRLFPFVTLLQWPSEDDLVHSPNGKFLQKLGCKQHPPLSAVLKYIASDALDGELRRQGLDYVCKNLGPKGVYEREYAPPTMRGRSASASLQNIKFLPCVRTDPLVPNSTIRELRGPSACFSNPHCMVMGFPCLDPELDKKSGKLYSSRFRCPEEPDSTSLVQQLLELVEKSQKTIQQTKAVDKQRVCTNVSTLFEDIFKYLSSRTDFDARTMKALQSHNFIPCKGKGSSNSNDSSGLIDWYRPTDVYFKSKNEKDEDCITEILFHVIEFSPFLAAAGVKSEATTHDLFQLTVLYPEKVLRALGSEEKYRALLRRIAANPPFKSVPPAISKAPFLLAYKIVDDDNDENNKGGIRKTQLAAAEDIYIVDNSFFGRMFPVLQAPHESDLEDFYCRLGSKYISKGVKKNFEVLGGFKEGTPLALQLAERLNERRPLLVSPSVTSRPLLSNASTVLDEKNIVIAQANDLKAVYSLGSSVRNQRITCCAKAAKGRRNVLFVTKDFDWFDVGYAIGALILQRCQLEDAFFIGSLLEAPLDQLRARGFPVDRILRPVEPVILHEEPPPPPQAPESAPKAPTPTPENPTAPKGQKPAENDEHGFQQILQQMFPDCSPDYIQALLGPDADLEKLQRIADELASGNYPKNTGPEGNKNDKAAEKDELNKIPPAQKTDKKSGKEGETKNKQKFGKRLSRALSGRKGNNSPDKKPPANNPLGGMNGGAVGDQQLPPRMETAQGQPSMNGHNDGRPKAPEDDAADNSRMESLLEQSVGQSNKVNPRGINSAETHLTHIPHSHERPDNGCEVIPAQHIKPFSGPYRTGKTKKGVRVFFSRQHPESEDFLNEHFHAVETFADVLEALCDIYSLTMKSVCIFHDPSGSTIAFNSNRSLHFNVRFFYSLHYAQNRQNSSDCYSYWFTTMAHELAHHLAAGHNKEHGFYTESYITKYLPKLAIMLAKLDG